MCCLDAQRHGPEELPPQLPNWECPIREPVLQGDACTGQVCSALAAEAAFPLPGTLPG